MAARAASASAAAPAGNRSEWVAQTMGLPSLIALAQATVARRSRWAGVSCTSAVVWTVAFLPAFRSTAQVTRPGRAFPPWSAETNRRPSGRLWLRCSPRASVVPMLRRVTV